MKLKHNVYSLFNPDRLYGRAGDEIKIVSPIIVEGPTGDRFTITEADILKEGEKIDTSEREMNQYKPAKRKGSRKSVNDQQLF